MIQAMKKPRGNAGQPTMQLKQYGSLQDILNSNASVEFKAACAEMAAGRP